MCTTREYYSNPFKTKTGENLTNLKRSNMKLKSKAKLNGVEMKENLKIINNCFPKQD